MLQGLCQKIIVFSYVSKCFLWGYLMIQMALPKKNKQCLEPLSVVCLWGMLMVQFVVCKALCSMYCLEFIVSCFENCFYTKCSITQNLVTLFIQPAFQLM